MLRSPYPSPFTALLLAVALASTARAGDDDLLTVKRQPQEKYYLIGAAPDAVTDKPPGLLLVMPGGDGSAEFHAFVTSIHGALPDGYLVVQLVAVESKDEKQVVWPTEKLKDKKQTFPTQQFIENVVKEVMAKHKLDENRIFTLGWSSSGSAAYGSVLTPKSPVKGAVVAMSVFQPGVLPDLAGAKGKRVVILHAAGDKLIPVRIAQMAENRLKTAGAEVQFVEMAGGHGWEDDPLGRITSAVEWLQDGAEKSP